MCIYTSNGFLFFLLVEFMYMWLYSNIGGGASNREVLLCLRFVGGDVLMGFRFLDS